MPLLTPPWDLMPSYITMFQSSPVRIWQTDTELVEARPCSLQTHAGICWINAFSFFPFPFFFLLMTFRQQCPWMKRRIYPGGEDEDMFDTWNNGSKGTDQIKEIYGVGSRVPRGFQTMVWFITRNTLLNLPYELCSHCAIVWIAHTHTHTHTLGFEITAQSNMPSCTRYAVWAVCQTHIWGSYSCCFMATEDKYWLIWSEERHAFCSAEVCLRCGLTQHTHTTHTHTHVSHRKLTTI